MENKNSLLFNSIAPIYGLFFNTQKKRYSTIIEDVKDELDLSSFESIIDVGCGTGALCSVLNEKGINVTGIDPAQKMLDIAIKKEKNSKVKFLQADVLEGLPFEDNTFNVAISAYVAHGLTAEERRQMYIEMSRIAKNYVIIHDYNDKKTILTSIIEWFEGGNYFHFIKNAESEMKGCVSETKNCFSDVRIINVGSKANWYVCKPNEY